MSVQSDTGQQSLYSDTVGGNRLLIVHEMDDSRMNVVLTPSGLIVNKTTFAVAPPLERILAAFDSVPSREKDLHDQGKLWRKFVIIDEMGVYFLYDLEIQRVLEVQFYFIIARSTSAPEAVYSGLLFVNGVRLFAGMKEALLPIRG